jgi:hypothetical protein
MKASHFYERTMLDVKLVAKTKREIDALARALRLVKRRDPRTFRRFRLLAAILVYPRRGYDIAVYMADDPRVLVCESGTVLESSSAYLAGLLVHEVTHMVQWKRGERKHGTRIETEAYRIQRRFLEKVAATDEVEWLDKQYEGKWWVTKSGKPNLGTATSVRHRKLLAAYRASALSFRK